MSEPLTDEEWERVKKSACEDEMPAPVRRDMYAIIATVESLKERWMSAENYVSHLQEEIAKLKGVI